VALDASGERVRLTLQSFHRPRWIEIFLGSEKVTEIPRVRSVLEAPAGDGGGESAAARPGEVRIEVDPVAVELTLPTDSRHVLRLRADGCEVPAELGLSVDRRCLAFQILGYEGIEGVWEVPPQNLVPLQSRTLHLPLPRAGKKRVTLKASSCDVPAKLGLNDDLRCLSFRLSLPEPWTVELFDSDKDPLQALDLSSSNSDLSLSMLRALGRYQLQPVAPASKLELDSAHEARLRALGYLP